MIGLLLLNPTKLCSWEIKDITTGDPNIVPYPYEGAGTEEFPYLISSADDLAYLCSVMMRKEGYSVGKYFKLTKDLVLNDRVLNENGTLVSDTAGLKKWQPIGEGETGRSYYAFQGVFDGAGHTISGIYMNDSTLKDQGLFGFLHRGAEIKNLVIKDSYIKGTGAVGAVSGQCYKGVIANCISYATVVSVGATIQVGGIVGSIHGTETNYRATLDSCINYGYVTGRSVPNEWGEMYNCYVGGVCGDISSSAIVRGCVNEGEVFADGWSAVGGITGTVTGSASLSGSINKGCISSNARIAMGGISGNNWSLVTGCSNEGEIVPTVKGTTVGGICGTCSFNARIYNSVNVANIKTDIDSLTVGGICGNARAESSYGSYYTINLSGCSNEGDIELGGSLSMAGGICGRNYSANILKSQNRGNITTTYRAAGISPLCEYHSSIEESENSGTIKGGNSWYIGGITGQTSDAVVACINRGSIFGGTVAGIAGYLSSSSCYVINCVNTGDITGRSKVGGIISHAVSSGSVRSCYNTGTISSNVKSHIGGIGGYTGAVSNSYNVGKVYSSGDGSYVGSISGYSYGNVTNCYGMGDVWVLGNECTAGNLVGDFGYSSHYYIGFKNCYYLENTLHGENFTPNYNEEYYLTALQEEDFKSLASKLNVVEYWGEALPYVQGYYRPVLANYYEDNEPSYFTVTRIDNNDTVFIDMGKPLDNTFFQTDTTGLVTEAYNVVTDSQTIQKAMIVDGKNLHLDRTLCAKELWYSRDKLNSRETFCLPFEIDPSDLTASSYVLLPTLVGKNYVCMNDTINSTIEAGTPFIVAFLDSIQSFTCKKENVTISPKVDSLSMLNGVFQNVSPDTLSFILEDSIFRRASGVDSLMAFRAYMKPGRSLETDTLWLMDKAMSYKISYYVDGVVYVTDSVTFGQTVTPVEFPVKEGYTFSGWNGLPDIMPEQDVVIEGIFTVNKYEVVYSLEGEAFAKDSVIYGTTITLLEVPAKEGYTFNGWGEVPETMPANDLALNGTYTVNTYALVYKVDGEVHKTDSLKYGETIVKEEALTKEGYTFSGWSEIPEVMPAEDVTITGSFTVNKYEVVYTLESEVFVKDSVVYGTVVTLPEVPAKEGYTFSGWGEVPETMPANDLTLNGTYTVKTYTLVYIVDGEEYATVEVTYGETISLMDAPEKEGYLFSGWSEIPETMPAHDVTVTGTFEVNGIRAVITTCLVDVYTLQGVKIREQIAVEELENELPRGIYIVNGKKVVVK